MKNRTIGIMALLSYLGFIPLALGAGQQTGNGGGVAEKNILYAYANIERFVGLCLSASSACKVSAAEKVVLGTIQKSLAEGKENAAVEFISEKAQQGVFLLDGQIRVAKTGDQLGDTIYVNSDLIYSKEGNGKYTPMDIPTAVSVLVHELGHHHGVKDHQFLDKMGTQVQIFLLNRFEQIGWNPVNPNESDSFRAVTIAFGQMDTFDQLLISDSKTLTNLTDLIKARVTCADGVAPTGFWLKNLHWGWGAALKQNARLFKQPLHAWLAPICKGSQGVVLGDGRTVDLALNQTADLAITLAFRFDQSGNFILQSDQTEVMVTACSMGAGQCN